MTERLVVDDLRVRFAGGPTLGPLTLRADVGVVWLQGANGTGKTTLLRCLCGERRPTSGSVRVHGDDPFAVASARAHVGFVPTDSELPPHLTVRDAWTLLAALRGAPRWSGDALCEALDLPPDLSLAHASAGQRRRAEFVAALAGDPDILLLDEVFATLDVAAVRLVGAWIDAWRTHRLIVLTGHAELPIAADVAIDLPCATSAARSG